MAALTRAWGPGCPGPTPAVSYCRAGLPGPSGVAPQARALCSGPALQSFFLLQSPGPGQHTDPGEPPCLTQWAQGPSSVIWGPRPHVTPPRPVLQECPRGLGAPTHSGEQRAAGNGGPVSGCTVPGAPRGLSPTPPGPTHHPQGAALQPQGLPSGSN